MKAQEPAEGILKTHDWGNSKWYQVVCGCGQDYHSHQVEVEADDAGVNVTVYATVKSDYWFETVKKNYDIDNIWLQEVEWFFKDLINGLISRLKVTWEVWVKGTVTAQTTITMTEQQAFNYSETLKSAIADVKSFRNSIAHQQTPIYKEGDCV